MRLALLVPLAVLVWSGQALKCDFGKVDCPDGAAFCAEPVCVCNAGFQGPSCSERVPEGISASAFLRSSAKDQQFRSARQDEGAPVAAATEEAKPEAAATEDAAEAAKPAKCQDAPQCRNGGKLNEGTCTCDCSGDFTGSDCSRCSSRPCSDNLSRDPETCECSCGLSHLVSRPEGACLHGGVFDERSCRCRCEEPWTGARCDVCLPQDCAHGGEWDPHTCQCRCPGPWDPADNCATCPVKDCKHGKFDPATCSCRCEGKWAGELCDACPSPQELALASVTCGNRGFDREKCACRSQCPPVDCLHGGEQDPDSCECMCNTANAPKPVPAAPTPAPAPSQPEDAADDNSTTPIIVESPEVVSNVSLTAYATATGRTAARASGLALLQAGAKQGEDAGDEEQKEQEGGDEEQEGGDEEEQEGGDEEQAGGDEEEQEETEEEQEETEEEQEETEEVADAASEEAADRGSWVPAVPLAAAQVAVSSLSLSVFSADTFWSGERCEVCQPPADLEARATAREDGHAASGLPYHVAPASCPPAHTFNLSTCACQPACPRNLCLNGGQPVLLEETGASSGPVRRGDTPPPQAMQAAASAFSKEADEVIARGRYTCGCRCRPPWSGDRCNTRASGATPVSAARSCLAVLRARPGAGTGRYWLNPSGVAPARNAFEAFCDMNEDGGGWTEVARVGPELANRLLDANSYQEGAAVGGGSEFVVPCARLNGLDGTSGSLRRFVLRLSMGQVRDYYRGAPQHGQGDAAAAVDLPTLCQVLGSHDKHLWSPFFRPSMVDGSEALLVKGADGSTAVVRDQQQGDGEVAGNEQTQGVTVVSTREEAGPARAGASYIGGDSAASQQTGEEGEEAEETPLVVQSLSAAQFRQQRRRVRQAAAAARKILGSGRRQLQQHDGSATIAPDTDRAAAAAAAAGVSDLWAYRGGIPAPPNSAEGVLSRVLGPYNSRKASNAEGRFREAGAAGSFRPAASTNPLDPDAASDRLLAALVGPTALSARALTAANRAAPVASAEAGVRSAASNVRFASARSSRGGTSAASGGMDWKKYSWMLPPAGFSGPFGGPAVSPGQYGGPSGATPPAPMASSASVYNSLATTPGMQPLPGTARSLSDVRSMAPTPQRILAFDGTALPHPHPDDVIVSDSARATISSPAAASLPATPQESRNPTLTITVGTSSAPAPVAVPDSNGRLPPPPGDGARFNIPQNPPALPVGPSPAGAEEFSGSKPIVVTMGQLAAAGARGTGPPGSMFDRMIPPPSPPQVGFSTPSVSGAYYNFREKRGTRVAHHHTTHHQQQHRHRHAATPSRSNEEENDPLALPRFRSARRTQAAAATSSSSSSSSSSALPASIRRALATAGLRPILGSGLAADDEHAWAARLAGTRAATALLQERAASSLLTALTPLTPSGLHTPAARVLARVVAASPSFLQAAARRQDEEEQEEEEEEGSETEEDTEEAAGGEEEQEEEETSEAAGKDSGKGEQRTPHNPSGWVRPAYVDSVMNPQLEGVLGGSRKVWPSEVDGRMYLSFWGGNRGGCCHERSENYGGEADRGGWARQFRLHVMEVDPALFAKGNDFDFGRREAELDGGASEDGEGEGEAQVATPRFKDEADPMEAV